MPRFAAMWYGMVASGCETLATIALFHPDPISIYHGVAYHAAAVVSCTAAARHRSKHRGVEEEAVLIAALFVPVFGPCLAWMFPNNKNPDVLVNAHAYLERFEGLARHTVLGLGCLREAGAFEASQVHPLSFAEILRHGSITQKRNALSKLAEIGGPRHYQMLRRVMAAENGELRLCAFIELSRLARRFEDRITDLHKELSSVTDHEAELRIGVELAEQHYGLAVSGLLDPEMERYHTQQALASIERPWRERPGDGPTARMRARVLSHNGEHEGALQGLGLLSAVELAHPLVRRVRAEIAFRMRDFDTLRREVKELLAAGEPCPEWMTVLQPSPTEESSELVCGGSQ